MVFLPRPRSPTFSRFCWNLPRKSSHSKRKLLLFSVVGGGGLCYLYTNAVQADADLDSRADKNDTTLRSASYTTLLRSYFVYSVCSWPTIVNYSPFIISAATAIPGLKQVAEVVIRHTFFAQFVGGDTAEKTLQVISQLRSNNIGALLAYSVEVDEDQAGRSKFPKSHISAHGYKANVEETIRSIDVAADFEERFRSQSGKRTWVAIKLTALLPSADSLIKLSDYIREGPLFPGISDTSDLQFLARGTTPPGFTADDVKILKELDVNLTRITERAYERDIKIVIDAEYTWFQPAIDVFTLSLMRRYNRIPEETAVSHQPLVYGTYQAYLKRTPQYLVRSLEDAEKHGYALGVKLVRGAYHHFETEAASSPDTCPVWNTKPETDSCFDDCAEILIAALKTSLSGKGSLGILFGTHNTESCDKILKQLLRNNLARYIEGRFVLNSCTADHCSIAQLYGMSDALTYSMVNRVQTDTPFVIKYIPYGPLISVMPYLGRRAVENSSILSANGNAAAERRRVGTELYRRLFKGF